MLDFAFFAKLVKRCKCVGKRDFLLEWPNGRAVQIGVVVVAKAEIDVVVVVVVWW